jgi:hypothetical protein
VQGQQTFSLCSMYNAWLQLHALSSQTEIWLDFDTVFIYSTTLSHNAIWTSRRRVLIGRDLQRLGVVSLTAVVELYAYVAAPLTEIYDGQSRTGDVGAAHSVSSSVPLSTA